MSCVGEQWSGMEGEIDFITGYGDVPMAVRAMKAGATEFLVKPFHEDVLLTAIDTALARSRLALVQQAAGRGYVNGAPRSAAASERSWTWW